MDFGDDLGHISPWTEPPESKVRPRWYFLWSGWLPGWLARNEHPLLAWDGWTYDMVDPFPLVWERGSISFSFLFFWTHCGGKKADEEQFGKSTRVCPSDVTEKARWMCAYFTTLPSQHTSFGHGNTSRCFRFLITF